MRPLPLLLALFAAIFAGSAFVLYAALGSGSGPGQSSHAQQQQHELGALFSFTSPGSLFPPSAIISLTDDNSTFFLARPAAFGPALPPDGLSSLLWAGRGFGDDAELGCSDSPAEAAESISGTIVLLKRGGCGFLAKVLWAQTRGAIAVIVGDNVQGGGLIRMYARGDTSSVSIPSVFTSHTTAHLLSSLLDPQSKSHSRLRVTLTPTTVSTSPFLDTLLVLVVSPLVTLTVVYALLLIRSRIRRRRWRAPKSLVERLPVRTYHTMADSDLSSPSPTSSSPATPLLQHSHEAASPTGAVTAQHQADMSATSSVQQGCRAREEEKRDTGLAEWRRRYGGRQRECVVCLEEYEDGISQVMSLPCGHEFHADCITPWLVTRRRTCPICKGDVVRSLAQSCQDSPQAPPPRQTNREHSQAQNLDASIQSPTTTDVAASSSLVPNNDEQASWSDNHMPHSEEDARTSIISSTHSSYGTRQSTTLHPDHPA